jgi:hypothetical protein
LRDQLATVADDRPVADHAPEWRRFGGWRGRLRPAPVKLAERAGLVWVSGSPWTVHYVQVPARRS